MLNAKLVGFGMDHQHMDGCKVEPVPQTSSTLFSTAAAYEAGAQNIRWNYY